MEIKIKNNKELVDATIEVKDGIMIVSPIKEEKFEPKEGDILAVGDGETIQVFICKEYLDKDGYSSHCFYDVDSDELSINDGCNYCFDHYATEEEKQRLFAKLAEAGWEWDVKERKLVKLKWKPGINEKYYAPAFPIAHFEAFEFQWMDTETGRSVYNKGWCFKTKQECQAFCDRLNEAINQVEP